MNSENAPLTNQDPTLEAMKEAVDNKADERARRVKEVTKLVTDKTDDNIKAMKVASEKPKIIIPK